jgi:hypothetical protein
LAAPEGSSEVHRPILCIYPGTSLPALGEATHVTVGAQREVVGVDLGHIVPDGVAVGLCPGGLLAGVASQFEAAESGRHALFNNKTNIIIFLLLLKSTH